MIGKFFISNILSLSCLLLFRIIGAGGGLGFTLTGLVISTLSGFGSSTLSSSYSCTVGTDMSQLEIIKIQPIKNRVNFIHY